MLPHKRCHEVRFYSDILGSYHVRHTWPILVHPIPDNVELSSPIIYSIRPMHPREPSEWFREAA